ncbi:MAG: hypothetical protein HY842_13005 [Bacteroidetes bacterium]|nr:hypothetical protein [Bacteroidota bacterium]
MRIVSAILLSFLLFSKTGTAQEQLGLRLESYAGVSSLALNPAGNLNNPLRWDINLVGAGVFFENNYVFLRQTSLPDLLRHRNDANFVAARDLEGTPPPNTFVVDFFNDSAKRYFQFSGFVAGPSVAVRIGENQSAGIFTNLRSAGSTTDVPNNFSFYKYDDRPFFDGFQVPELSGALLNWAEIGLNYAFRIPTADGSMNFGINLKYLQGYEAGYLENLGTYQHTKLPNNTVSLGQPNGRYGYAAESNDAVFAERNGRGIGADLGFTYIFQDHEEGYKLKLGAALLDLGTLKFDKNAQAHRVRTDSTVLVMLDDYDHFENLQELDDLIRQFSRDVLADSLASFESNTFCMALPAALSLSADYGMTEHFYVNALLVQRLPTLSITAKRGNLFALTPRWQHRWFSVSAPVSIYNWDEFHLGLAARLGFLVVGSDNVGSIFSKGNYTGSDFYFAIKINPFKLGNSDGGSRGKRRFGRNGRVKCYEF